MKHYFFFLFFLYAFTTLGQTAPNVTDAAGKKQGHWIKYDTNNKKIYEGTFKNNIPVGKFTYFYENGIPWAVTIFSNNGTIARTKHYSGGGKLMGEGKYINEQKDSLWKFYNEDSVLLSEENYVKGLKNGSSKIYYPNGQVSEDKTWKNGKLNGPCKKYFETGQLKYTGQYVDDKLEGKTIYYFSSGKIDGEGVYKGDLKDGIWKYYTEDGKTRRTDKYINGRMVESTDKEKDVISKEQQDEEKKKFEQFDLKDPFQEGYHPE